MASTVTPNRVAIPESVSPDCTVYVVAPTVGRGRGVSVGVGTGVINKRMRSPLTLLPSPHPTKDDASMIDNRLLHVRRRSPIYRPPPLMIPVLGIRGMTTVGRPDPDWVITCGDSVDRAVG
jgi:hypothetical protein